jgi:hypothetical protein
MYVENHCYYFLSPWGRGCQVRGKNIFLSTLTPSLSRQQERELMFFPSRFCVAGFVGGGVMEINRRTHIMSALVFP